ncbi:MAG TPA: RsmB/NOP family class I SAM-dependent RNA methyltransferase [Opitutaceae bacterium]|nr:RsmB/NOP family class I SAM-dependent RNA methyltransferase [Opitutaceae bacterium]
MRRLVKQGFPGAGGTGRRAVSRGRIGAGSAGNGWVLAVLLVERWLASGARVDVLLEQLTAEVAPAERARAQQLFFGVVRWRGRIEAALAGLMARPPRTKVRAVLLVAGFELIAQRTKARAAGAAPDDGPAALVVHHAVEEAKSVCSPKEAGLVNAVARKMAGRLAVAAAEEADEFSHPEWLVARWRRLFGNEATRELMLWNLTPAPVMARWRAEEPPPEFLLPARWEGFYELPSGHGEDLRRLVQAGALYVQDPSTRLAIDLLAPRAGETILDACAAPGGKSLFMADRMRTGRIVALDLPAEDDGADPRIRRLQENLSRAPAGVEIALMPADLRRTSPRTLEEFNLPGSYDAVIVDAPCSNTGVMRHRVDVKWRLEEGDFAKHAAQQFHLLRAGARLVADGGRLVYSTCSIDAEENDGVVQRFLREVPGWQLEQGVQAFPWLDGHDGVAAFLLRRK